MVILAFVIFSSKDSHHLFLEFQLQATSVCFGSRGSQFGKFSAKKSGSILAVKLVHKSGKISCISSKAGLSNFGCHTMAEISVALTTTLDQVIFPKKLPARPWYKAPGYNSQSTAVILRNPSNFNNVKTGQIIRLWYGEDLENFTEGDNHGKSCVDVYFQFRN